MGIFNGLLILSIVILVLLLVASYGYNLAKKQAKERLEYVLQTMRKYPAPIVYADAKCDKVWLTCIDTVDKAYEELITIA